MRVLTRSPEQCFPERATREALPAERGFTLVELVVVLVLLGILAVVVIPRLSGTTTTTARAYFESLQSAARYARHFASSHGCPVSFTADNTTVQLLRTGNGPPACDGGTTGLAHPGDLRQTFHQYFTQQFDSLPPDGVTVSGGTVTFQADGSAGADLTVQVSGGGLSTQFNIHGSTGFVEAN